MRVLVIEDDPASRELATRVVAHAGHSVVTAENGREGLRRALGQRPELILLDLHLPDVAGWTVARELREQEAFRATPIIALSAGSDEDRERALEAGCSGFISKPYEPAVLLAAVEQHVSADAVL